MTWTGRTPAHTEYALWACSDCHPDTWDEDSGEERYELPYEVVLPVDGAVVAEAKREPVCPLDRCPRCQSHLSLLFEKRVRVERAR
jgi:hypothetical protein